MCKCHDIYASGKESAKKHSKISHYTTFEALKCILEYNSLRLTRLDMLNDAYENKRINDVLKEKIFTTCFTYRETESNMFWSLYAKDKGVMLTLITNYSITIILMFMPIPIVQFHFLNMKEAIPVINEIQIII